MAASGIQGLRSVVLDCPQPWKLAEFYLELLGGEIRQEESEDSWVVLMEPHGRRIAFQPAPEYRPPRFPDPAGSQQIHLDILVSDIDVAEPAVLALGAQPVPVRPPDDGPGIFRVYTDPVGHTF